MSANAILQSEGTLNWRDYNPELQIKVGKLSVKFHYDSLEDVIALEELHLKKKGMRSGILTEQSWIP